MALGERPLRIAVDFPWDASACMGTGSYSETMVRALAKADPEATIFLIVPRGAPKSINLANIRYEPLPPADGLREGTRQVALPALLDRIKADCLFAPATLLPLVKTCPMVATVHDLTFVKHPEYYSSGLIEYLDRWFDPALRVADSLVAISEETRDDLVELKGTRPDRVAIIKQPVREGLSRRLSQAEVEARLDSMGISKPYFFHVSNLAPHKNVTFALEVFRDFLRNHEDAGHLFVLAGGINAPNQPPDLELVARRLGIGDRIRYAGRVGDDRLTALYQGCDAFLFPSLAEGWGLPVAEASGLGARVIASPIVPAASKSQSLPLESRAWVEAMSDKTFGKAALPAVAFIESGGQLLDLLTQVSGRMVLPESVPAESFRSHGVSPARLPGISGCTIIRNGVRLRYPFEESVASYASLCDEVVVCWDPTSEDATAELLGKIAARFPNVRLVESAWDMGNRQEGTELARQTQIAFSQCRHEWTLYVQADEALHEGHHELLRSCVTDPDLDAVAFRRLSFFGCLDREIADHRTRGMVRMFRTGYGRSVGDAMHVRLEGHVGRIKDSEATLFNYSRLGTDADIIARCTNLHRFYHDDKWLSDREPDIELRIPTVPFEGSHPAPIEARFRRGAGPMSRTGPARVSVHVIAQERDRFGADLLGSCLDALAGYADQIVLVDNGLGPDAEDVVKTRSRYLPLNVVNAREVTNDFAELRNRALAVTDPGMTHIHKIDSDEVYLPGSLNELKELLSTSGNHHFSATLVHFMIEPTLVESSQSKDVIFRHEQSLAWEGAVHEKMGGATSGRSANSPARFLHFGYCRPQWQTMLKWLRYASLQSCDFSHFQYELIDGVRRPWFRDGRTPDTILEPRRHRLEHYKDPYPVSVRPWLEEFARSGQTWREWVGSRVGNGPWDEWQALFHDVGCWEGTLDEVSSRSTARYRHGGQVATIAPPVAQALSRARSSKNEYRRGFSILVPTWNNLSYLKKLVESLRAHSEYDHEIILHVNDGSDGTLEWARKSGIKHTFTPENVGICTAINRATNLSSRDLVMYWNDDMVALPEWDRQIVGYAETHDLDELAWLSSTLIEPTGENPSFIAPADYGTDIEHFDESRLLADLPSLRTRKPDFMGTSWAPNLLRRDTFDRVGRFSEEFSPGFGSDPDLVKKLWDLGMRHFVGVGMSLVYHFQCKGTGKIPKHLHNDAHGTFFRKYGMSIQDFILGVLRPQSRVPARMGCA